MGNILTACSSKKHFDKVDDFINVSVHGNVKVVVKAEEKVEEKAEEKVEENTNVKVEECIEENADWKEVDTTATATASTSTSTIEQNKL
jgi:D-alanyl-D-alanine carboxypeptidase